jgi:hypothetical protein
MVEPRTRLLLAAALTSLAGALPGADILRVGEGSARPGQTHIPIALSASHDLPIQGFSVSLWFSPRDLAVSDVTYAGTVVEPLNPEYFNSVVDGTAGNVALAVILEISPPFELVSLPPDPAGMDTIAWVIFDVQPGAAAGPVALNLGNSPGLHPIRNVFTDLGSSIVPALEPGLFQVLPRPFRRGLINGDGRIDISDAIFLFGYLFLGGAPPACMAAANINGDGRVDLSDAIWLLSWIFRGGSPPPEPFLQCGLGREEPLRAPCEGAAVCP